MNVSEYTCEAFLACTLEDCEGDEASVDDNIFALYPPNGPKLYDLPNGYSIHGINCDNSDVSLQKSEETVGIYAENSLMIHSKHRGNHLATSLILAASERRQLPSSRKATRKGWNALKRAWCVAKGLADENWDNRSQPT